MRRAAVGRTGPPDGPAQAMTADNPGVAGGHPCRGDGPVTAPTCA
jgi:hypothetical protein